MIFSGWFDKFKRFGRFGAQVSRLQENGEKEPVSRKDSMDKDPEKGGPPKRRERIKIDLLIHDLKVPLAVIDAGVSSMLNRREKYGPLTEKQERVLRRVLRNTRVTQTLVNDALELGRSREGIVNMGDSRISEVIEQSLVEIFDLADGQTSEKIKACSELCELRRVLEEKGLLLFIDEGLWCQQVRLDRAKVTQILRNLLGNALKYRRARVELHVERSDAFLVLSVKDDGEGIPATHHERIFECYFQMDGSQVCTVRGHGLGLAGVMVLVEDLGGELTLDSDEGQGARFQVRIPISTGR